MTSQRFPFLRTPAGVEVQAQRRVVQRFREERRGRFHVANGLRGQGLRPVHSLHLHRSEAMAGECPLDHR